MNHTALIGDLVGSRGIAGQRRGAIQRDLTEYFAGLTPEESPGLRSQPTLTLGDEFQALFSAHERPSAFRWTTTVDSASISHETSRTVSRTGARPIATSSLLHFYAD